MAIDWGEHWDMILDLIYGIELGYDIGISHLHFQVPSSMGKEHLEMSGRYLEVNLPHETATSSTATITGFEPTKHRSFSGQTKHVPATI